MENDADQAAVDIALNRYRHGLSTYIDVLNQQSSLVQIHQSLIQAEVAATDDLVTLYKALGGGWQGEIASMAQPSFWNELAELND